MAISTLRAGNVIGGGDFAPHRILPDCIRSALQHQPVRLRHPEAVRPYQHVLEPLSAYLWTGWKQWEDPSLAGSYNVAPREERGITTGELATLFCECWGEGMRWYAQQDEAFPKEAGVLRLRGEKIAHQLGWAPRWDLKRAVMEAVRWTKVWRDQGDIQAEMEREIARYEEGER